MSDKNLNIDQPVVKEKQFELKLICKGDMSEINIKSPLLEKFIEYLKKELPIKMMSNNQTPGTLYHSISFSGYEVNFAQDDPNYEWPNVAILMAKGIGSGVTIKYTGEDTSEVLDEICESAKKIVKELNHDFIKTELFENDIIKVEKLPHKIVVHRLVYDKKETLDEIIKKNKTILGEKENEKENKDKKYMTNIVLNTYTVSDSGCIKLLQNKELFNLLKMI